MKKNYKTKLGLFVPVFLVMMKLTGQQSYTFTNCGATGSVGPTQTMINNTYTNTNLAGMVTATTNGIQTWTVPYTGNYRIDARGAQGGTSGTTAGGLGATMIGDFALNGGEVIQILVGQQGESGGSGPGGGGGGTYVVRTPYNATTAILVIAGAGSGAGSYATNGGLIGTSGGNGGGLGGQNGNGGAGGSRGAGAGGFLTNGGNCTVNVNYASPGQAYVNGGLGGPRTNHTCGFTASGGFGGGSSHGGNCINNGGAGGGFSGGGGSSNNPSGAGGSLNAGTNQTNTAASNSGHGRVIITELCSVRIYASGSNSTNPVICSGTSLTLTTDAVSGYTWSTGANTNSIVVAPTTNTVYTIVATSSANCQSQGVINVQVDQGVPVISITNPSGSICLGATTSLSASGANSYTWTNAGVVNGQTFAPTSTEIYTVSGQNACGITTQTTSIVVDPVAINVTASPTLVCQGSPSTLTAVSAVNIYNWQPNNVTGSMTIVAPTANSIYTVSATDGTCIGSATVAVDTKITPTVNVSATASVMCAGQQVVITATGADTYTWNPGGMTGASVTVSPASPSLYVVTGENTVGCIHTAQQIVLVNASPTISATASKTLVCSGQSLTLNATGGNSYVWTNGPSTSSFVATPSASAVYTVTGGHSSNTCTTVKTVTVTAIVPNVTLPTNTQVCIGNSVAVYASGASNYVWNLISTGSVGMYTMQPTSTTTVTLVANTQSLSLNCPVSHTFQVLVNPLPTLSVTPSLSVVCRYETNTLTVSGAQNYTWTGSVTGNFLVITPSANIVYTVMGTDNNGCTQTLYYQAKVNACTGVEEVLANSSRFQVYPNPNNGSFVVRGDASCTLTLVNSLGQVLRTFELKEDQQFTFEIKDLSAGVYFIRDQSGEKNIVQKVIVN
jgi:hypothetical protein